MYKCESCGAKFEEPAKYTGGCGEYQGHFACETLTGCPECYSGRYREMTLKERLGEEDEEENGKI